MSSPAKDLRDYLVAQGISTAATTFYGQDMPAEPDEVTFVRDTPSFQPQEFMGTDAIVEQCGVQVLIRAASDAAGQTRVDACYASLRKINNATINGTRYQAVTVVSPPFVLGRDADDVKTSGGAGRPSWSLNFLAHRDVA